MEKIAKFETKEQKEFNKLYDELEAENKKIAKMIDKKCKKADFGGTLTEADAEEMLLGLAHRARNSRILHKAYAKINPEDAAKSDEEEKQLIIEATKEYIKEKHGIERIK